MKTKNVAVDRNYFGTLQLILYRFNETDEFIRSIEGALKVTKESITLSVVKRHLATYLTIEVDLSLVFSAFVRF